jgi:uncharacterized protein YprB with RNaseH-like and TPR domain
LLSPELRKRLSELNQGALRLAAKSRTSDVPAAAPSAPLPLAEAFPGTEVGTPIGRFLLWERPMEQVISHSDDLRSSFVSVFERGAFGGDPERFHPDVFRVLECDPSRIFFLDIETTGLTAGPVFLIGLLGCDGGQLVLRQLLARDYSEEPALLHGLSEFLPRFGAVVTFNGKSFDLRYLRERFIATGVSGAAEFHHLDLLHEGRRQWKGQLPNCKLQTLEHHVCGRVRHGDVPGADIPQAYHDFVRTGDARVLKGIVHHNALDLIALAEVLLHIVRET